ncbi:hypothetical protein H6G33_28435 [Calothrix sp. FACHB-1219]|nr:MULTISPECIES: hypothetical protein [unclassified Calothrix]MBD2206137.1 hypothetical protein [Calothrix sp. FACHB-168]MBD2220908.1 hypothetical protein [Calothrix sp. FACHB-1219]
MYKTGWSAIAFDVAVGDRIILRLSPLEQFIIHLTTEAQRTQRFEDS